MKLPLRISATQYIIDSSGNIIAAVSEFGLADAKEIIRACNVHDELLRMVRDLVTCIKVQQTYEKCTGISNPEHWDPLINQAEGVIAKATGESP